MGEDEAKIIEYGKRQLAQRQHEKLSKKDARYFERLAQGFCGKCGKHLKVRGANHALIVKGPPTKYSPAELLAKGNLKGESFHLSCGHVVTTVPYPPDFQIKTSRWMAANGDDYSIRQFEKDKRTTEQYEMDLVKKFIEKQYPEYDELKKAAEDSHIDIIARKRDNPDPMLFQVTTLFPGDKLWKGMYGEGYAHFEDNPKDTEGDLIKRLEEKKYDPSVYRELILLINTWPLNPENVKEGLSGLTSELLEDRNYHEVWLIHEETGDTARIWPV